MSTGTDSEKRDAKVNDEEKSPEITKTTFNEISQRMLWDVFEHGGGKVTSTTFTDDPEMPFVVIQVANNGNRITYRCPLSEYMITFADLYMEKEGQVELDKRRHA